jgi:hypothetical protein
MMVMMKEASGACPVSVALASNILSMLVKEYNEDKDGSKSRSD